MNFRKEDHFRPSVSPIRSELCSWCWESSPQFRFRSNLGGGVGAAMVVSVAALLGVVASASRGAMLGAIAAGLTVWLVRRPRLNLRRTILVLAAGGLAAVAISPVRMAASNSIDRIVAAGDTSPGGSVAMRLDLWAVGVEMIRLRPVLGWGPDTYAIVFPEVDDRVLDTGSKAVLDQFRPESPHNLFLEVTQGAGLLGLGAMMTVIGGAVAMIIRGDVPRVLGLVLPVIVGYLVAAQFMTSEWRARHCSGWFLALA